MLQKVLLSAFACDPSKGSEPGNGWSWSTGLAQRDYEVHCLTRITGKSAIEESALKSHLHFHYVTLPFGLERLYHSSTIGMYLYYLIWQWSAYRVAKNLHKKIGFTVAHHVTWGSFQMGSFMYKLKIPFVFGPAGGGQVAPTAFKKYFTKYWDSEVKREKLSNFLLKYNPACRDMLKNARTVLVSNPETFEMAKKQGANNVHLELDASLPNSFLADEFEKKMKSDQCLKLLWTGRFMPRKGILLLLEVMKRLKNYPEITLTVVGDGEMADEFERTRKQFELADTVIWPGAVPHHTIKEYYKSHDAFFFTSLRDSCPAQLLEAMAFALPIITLNLHGQAYMITDETGTKADVTSPEETIELLKNAIIELYNNPALLYRKGQAALHFAKRQSWDEKIERIVKLYYPKL